jgi:hypothetical protein
MRLATLDEDELAGDNQKIGAPSHWRRNLWLVFGLAGAAFTMTLYYAFLGRHDTAELERLERFRAAYARKCDAPDDAHRHDAAARRRDALMTIVSMHLLSVRPGRACEHAAQALERRSDLDPIWSEDHLAQVGLV